MMVYVRGVMEKFECVRFLVWYLVVSKANIASTTIGIRNLNRKLMGNLHELNGSVKRTPTASVSDCS